MLVEIFLSIESEFEQIAVSLRAPDEEGPLENHLKDDRSEDLIPEAVGDLLESITRLPITSLSTPHSPE